jgi:hypothetical protein
MLRSKQLICSFLQDEAETAESSGTTPESSTEALQVKGKEKEASASKIEVSVILKIKINA